MYPIGRRAGLQDGRGFAATIDFSPLRLMRGGGGGGAPRLRDSGSWAAARQHGNHRTFAKATLGQIG